MQIIDTGDGNLFTLDGEHVARLLPDPLDPKPYRVYDTTGGGHSIDLNHREATVVAHALLSGLRSRADSAVSDSAFAHVLKWLEEYAAEHSEKVVQP